MPAATGADWWAAHPAAIAVLVLVLTSVAGTCLWLLYRESRQLPINPFRPRVGGARAATVSDTNAPVSVEEKVTLATPTLAEDGPGSWRAQVGKTGTGLEAALLKPPRVLADKDKYTSAVKVQDASRSSSYASLASLPPTNGAVAPTPATPAARRHSQPAKPASVSPNDPNTDTQPRRYSQPVRRKPVPPAFPFEQRPPRPQSIPAPAVAQTRRNDNVSVSRHFSVPAMLPPVAPPPHTPTVAAAWDNWVVPLSPPTPALTAAAAAAQQPHSYPPTTPPLTITPPSPLSPVICKVPGQRASMPVLGGHKHDASKSSFGTLGSMGSLASLASLGSPLLNGTPQHAMAVLQQQHVQRWTPPPPPPSTWSLSARRANRSHSVSLSPVANPRRNSRSHSLTVTIPPVPSLSLPHASPTYRTERNPRGDELRDALPLLMTGHCHSKRPIGLGVGGGCGTKRVSFSDTPSLSTSTSTSALSSNHSSMPSSTTPSSGSGSGSGSSGSSGESAGTPSPPMKHTEYTPPPSYASYTDLARPALAHMSALERTGGGSTAVLLQNQSLPPGAKGAVVTSVGTPHPFFGGATPGAGGGEGPGQGRRRAEVRRSAPVVRTGERERGTLSLSSSAISVSSGGGILKPSSSSSSFASHLDRRGLPKNVSMPHQDHHGRGVRHSAPIPLAVANVLPNGLGILPGMSMSLPAGIPNPGPNGGVVYIGVIVDDPRRHPADLPGPGGLGMYPGRGQIQSPPQLLPLFHQQQRRLQQQQHQQQQQAYRQSMPVYLHSAAAPQPSYAGQPSPGPIHAPHAPQHEYQAAPYYIPALRFPTPTPRLEDDRLSVRSVPRSMPRSVSQPLARPVHPVSPSITTYPPPPASPCRADTHNRHMSLPPSESEIGSGSESERRMRTGPYRARPASADIGLAV